jgi:hypothetical protein
MNITEILGYGLSGLCFLLFVLSFRLISQEQKQTQPRKSILQIIMLFMFLTLASTLAVGWVGIVQMGENRKLAEVNNKLLKSDTINTQLTRIDKWADNINDEDKFKGLTAKAKTDSIREDANKLTATADTITTSVLADPEALPEEKQAVQVANQQIAAANGALKNLRPEDSVTRKKLVTGIKRNQTEMRTVVNNLRLRNIKTLTQKN